MSTPSRSGSQVVDFEAYVARVQRDDLRITPEAHKVAHATGLTLSKEQAAWVDRWRHPRDSRVR